MSVPNQTPYIIYNANGLTTVFPFEFYIINAGDLQVSINGTTVTSGYSVSGTGNVGGGDVTFITPPASGSVVMLERVVPTYRLTDYQDNGDLLADTVNKDFDRLWMAIQRSFIYLGLALRRPLLGGPFNAEGYRISNLDDPINDQDAATKKWVQQTSQTNFNRTLRVPESSVNILPPSEQRANKLLAFNAAGQPVPVLPQNGSASDVMLELAKPTGADKIGYQHPYNSDVLVTLKNLLDDRISVTQFGVVPDGTDVTAKLCAALDAANGDYSQLVEYGKNRKTLYIPPGDYVVDMTKLTGIHASAGRFVIRCNIDCVGRIPNGDFLVAHVRSISVSVLSGKSLTIRGFQYCKFTNIDCSGDITLMGSQSYTLPGLIN
ncbi:hypothetical protein WMA84_001960 [Enterobacter hormaechei subsp. xiangfangensis]|uniref:phage tail fiber domain-containing protein n=1 Tax=Enterobacter hormaechei TaxID=158836 RepID=UPI001E32CDFF|nr:phage tail fiber protein [Enterobacter hormaechei]MCC4518824.1 hypothetical protein [Enterobacter hormaechei]MCC4544015.1 hypothetical protein [Enterobacter hormaechei]MCC4550222.1 hypothetical protein [Enterobacter hormaechei]HCJ6300296.1 hypothetical protein [Enterobacter hormaechei subsp. xiangfangensis]